MTTWRPFVVTRTYRAKRIVDITLSLILLFLTSPLFPLIALAIWLTSRGPVIFKQKRLGCRGIEFTIFKFRTMKNGAWTSMVVTRKDSRVTRVGRFLRETHLDELPQLVNVLRGDMSMVGPRPHEIRMAEDLRRSVPGYEECLRMRPGIMGPSQIIGREKVDIHGRHYEVQLNLRYSERMSLFHDFRVMMGTVPHILRRQGV